MIILAEDVKRDKQKGFKASQETVDKIDNLIKKSGKGPTEFFEDLVNDLAIQSVVDKNNDEISPDLRKHFESDVQKLKNATSSIVSIFVSQMENIAVEKNQWQTFTEKQLKEKQDAHEKLDAEFNELKQQFDEGKHQLTELTKINDTLTKEQDTLTKRTQDQEQLIQDRTEKIKELNERINKLNENIVDKDEQLKAIEPIREEIKALKQEIQSLTHEKEKSIEQIERLKEKHIEELKKREETLIFTCEKEKHKLETKLTDKFIKDKEELRNEVRKETEKNIREFYLAEINRKESEFKSKEDEYKKQIEQLQEEIKSLKAPKKDEKK